jgi:hypothetical protein
MTENQPAYHRIHHTESRAGRTSPTVALDSTTHVGGSDCRPSIPSTRECPLWPSPVLETAGELRCLDIRWPSIMLLGNAKRNGRRGNPEVSGRTTPREAELKTARRVKAIK